MAHFSFDHSTQKWLKTNLSNTDVTELTIEYEGLKPWKAKELVIGKYAGQRPKLPDYLNTKPADSSRLLEAAEHKHKERQEHIKPAVSYSAVWKEDTGNV